MGSGTTGAVSKQLNRNFIGIEISKEYFDIASKRIQEEREQELNFKQDKNYEIQQTKLLEPVVKYKTTKKTKI